MTFYPIKVVPESDKELIAVHGSSGSIMRFYGLAKGLSISFGAIQASGVNPGTLPLHSVEEMAKQYFHELQRRRRAHLLGYCWGGLVAYELFHKMKGKLVLIDPVVPLHGASGDEIVADRLKHRKKPKDPPPFDKVTLACWDAANAYRPKIPKSPKPEALIIWCQDTFAKMTARRQELHPQTWDKYLDATHVFINVNQKELFLPPNLVRISNIIEGYL